MDNRSKQHHFVPQSLLKNFSIDNKRKRIFVFDKNSLESFPSSINKTGSEKFFHSIRLKELGIEFNFEEYFDIPDNTFSEIITKILNAGSLKTLEATERENLIFLTALQFLRTRKSRNQIIGISETLSGIAERIKEDFDVLDENISPPVDKLSEDQAKIIILDLKERARELSLSLKNKFASLIKTNDSNPFWCSDSPVIKNNTQPYSEQGFNSRGIEVYFPLSKNYCLKFICNSLIHSKFGSIAKEANIEIDNYINSNNFKITQQSDEQEVLYVNSLLTRDSFRFVYSNMNNFGMAEKFLCEYPKFRNISKNLELEDSSSSILKNMPLGAYLVIFGKLENYTIKLQKYDLGNLEFETEDIAQVKRIINDYPLKEVKVIDDKEIKILFRALEIEWVDEKSNLFKLKFTNLGLAEFYKNNL